MCSKLIAIQHSFAKSDFEVMNMKEAEDIKHTFNEVMGKELYDDKNQLSDQLTKQPLASIKYQIEYEDKQIEDLTDEQGYTQIIEEDHPAEVSIKTLIDEEE